MAGEYYEIGLVDSSDEEATTRINVGTLTAATLPGALTAMGNLETAILAVTLGSKSKTAWGDVDRFVYTINDAADNQRGIKWTVVARDTVTGVPVINRIGTADLSLLPVVAGKRSEDLDLTADEGLALKTAWEALAKSPGGNAVAVERVYYSD